MTWPLVSSRVQPSRLTGRRLWVELGRHPVIEPRASEGSPLPSSPARTSPGSPGLLGITVGPRQQLIQFIGEDHRGSVDGSGLCWRCRLREARQRLATHPRGHLHAVVDPGLEVPVRDIVESGEPSWMWRASPLPVTVT